MYKIVNRTLQPIPLDNGKIINSNDFILIKEISEQVKNLADKGILSIRKGKY